MPVTNDTKPLPLKDFIGLVHAGEFHPVNAGGREQHLVQYPETMPPQIPSADEITNVIHTRELHDVLQEIREKISYSPHGSTTLDPLEITCCKTGQPLGKRDANSLFAAISAIGKAPVIESILKNNGLTVHPAWLFSDDRLDALMMHDAYGYAVYCFGLMTAKFYGTSLPNQGISTVPKREHLARANDQHFARARAWKIISRMPIDHAHALNDTLYGFMTFSPDSSRIFFATYGKKTPDQLAFLAASGKLLAMLDAATEKAIDSRQLHEIAINNQDNRYYIETRKREVVTELDVYPWEKITYEFYQVRVPCENNAAISRKIKRKMFEVIPNTIDETARGPSQIRRQTKSKKMLNELKLAFAVDQWFQAATGESSDTWKERFRREREPEIGLDASIESAIGDLLSASIGDDNEVEIRTISRAELNGAGERRERPNSLHTERPLQAQAQAPQIQAANSISALRERFKRK